MKLQHLRFLPAAIALCGDAQATVVSITNGNFEAQTPTDGGAIQFITSWFESTSSGYQDWLFRSTNNNVIAGNSSTLLGFSSTGGYVYQQIGSYTVGEQVTVSGDAFKRGLAASSQFSGFKIELLAGNFTGADGTALVATLLGSQDFTATDLGLPTSGTTSASSPFSVTFDSGSSGVEGSALWVRLSKLGTSGEIFLDNLAAVPEPSALLLGAIGLVPLMVRRRES